MTKVRNDWMSDSSMFVYVWTQVEWMEGFSRILRKIQIDWSFSPKEGEGAINNGKGRGNLDAFLYTIKQHGCPIGSSYHTTSVSLNKMDVEVVW